MCPRVCILLGVLYLTTAASGTQHIAQSWIITTVAPSTTTRRSEDASLKPDNDVPTVGGNVLEGSVNLVDTCTGKTHVQDVELSEVVTDSNRADNMDASTVIINQDATIISGLEATGPNETSTRHEHDAATGNKGDIDNDLDIDISDDVTDAAVVGDEDEKDASENSVANEEMTTEVTYPRTTTEAEVAPGSEDSVRVVTLNVQSDIQLRYARTMVTSSITNEGGTPQQVKFNVTLPETAFISKFIIEHEGELLEAVVKEKRQAQHDYQDAVSAGQTAAHVAVSSRESNVFVVEMNVEPMGDVSFNLTYEELLTRRRSVYTHTVTLTPDQVVDDMSIDVFILEPRNITTLQVSAFGNAVDSTREEVSEFGPSITRTSAQSVHIHFSPTRRQQARYLSDQTHHDYNQLIVKYDVDRTTHPAGEVMLMDGYFVHFFAPESMAALPKHIIFVLDTSGSMFGRKMQQLQEAMLSILDTLKQDDYFSIVQFATHVQEWTIRPQHMVGLSKYKATHRVTPENIEKAKHFITAMEASGGTNINGALRQGLQLAAKRQYEEPTDKDEQHQYPQPMMIFLTDGIPTVGDTRVPKILANARAVNTEIKVAIFSLAFGKSANFRFLKKLSLQNDGFARTIYEASDAALQLQQFYEEIASPLLANVTFVYADSVEKNSTTRDTFPLYYSGGEVVVAGQLEDKETEDIDVEVSAFAASHIIFKHFKAHKKHRGSYREPQTGMLERLWAYLTIKQLLDRQLSEESDLPHLHYDTSSTDAVEMRHAALNLALHYGFVTPLTSLVVVTEDGVSKDIHPQLINEDSDNDEESYMESYAIQNKILPVLMPSHKPLRTTTASPKKPNNSTELPKDKSPEDIKLTLSDVAWFSEHLDSSGNLKVFLNDTWEAFTLEQSSETTQQSSRPCRTPGGEDGNCEPMTSCVLPQFSNNYDEFLKYFCPIERLSGVCCPNKFIQNL